MVSLSNSTSQIGGRIWIKQLNQLNISKTRQKVIILKENHLLDLNKSLGHKTVFYTIQYIIIEYMYI